MPGLVDSVADERELLLRYLAQQRHVLRLAAYGLSDEQARSVPSASALSVASLIKHVAAVERGWVELASGRGAGSLDDYQGSFRLEDGETLATLLERYGEVADETEKSIGGIDDLGSTVPVPHDVPWFPSDVDEWPVRWILLHLIEETARHAGHADIVRESVDGATAYPLMAAAEGWPATPWLEPWRPTSA